MRALGYDWAEIPDANIILIKCGRSSYSLPCADDLMMIPGSRNNSQGVIEFLSALAKHKAMTRKQDGAGLSNTG
jgi:hypothetical protein